VTRAVRPTSLADALAALAEPSAVAIAGATDLMVGEGLAEAPAVVDVLRLPELLGIRRTDTCFDIGAATSFSRIRGDLGLCDMFPILGQAAATVGGWQIQNRATLGGNIANASPAGDSLPVLLALDAELVIAGSGGERVLAYRDFHVGYRQTALEPGELIVRVRMPVPSPGVQRFKKVGTRAAQAISKVVVAFAAESSAGTLTAVRVAAGSVAATPVRLTETEALLTGARPSAGLADRAAACASSEVTPIDDIRSTAAYRRHVIGRVVRRMTLSVAGG